MHCSWFVRNFFGENAPNVRRDMETHPEFMESFRFCFWTVSQITRNPQFGPKLHEHFDRKYGWALNKWDVCACVSVDVDVNVNVCALHIYISFFCTHKQFETRIYAYLLFHVRSSNGWMHAKWRVWCKHRNTQSSSWLKCICELEESVETTPEFICEHGYERQNESAYMR